MMIGTWIASQGVPESTGGIGWMNGSIGSRSTSTMASAAIAAALRTRIRLRMQDASRRRRRGRRPSRGRASTRTCSTPGCGRRSASASAMPQVITAKPATRRAPRDDVERRVGPWPSPRSRAGAQQGQQPPGDPRRAGAVVEELPRHGARPAGAPPTRPESSTARSSAAVCACSGTVQGSPGWAAGTRRRALWSRSCCIHSRRPSSFCAAFSSGARALLPLLPGLGRARSAPGASCSRRGPRTRT